MAQPNTLATGLATIGALMAGLSAFLPRANSPGLLPLPENTIAQTDGTVAVALAVILLVGAFLLGNYDGYFEFNVGSSRLFSETIQASPGIAFYVAGAGGAAALLGGFMMRDTRARNDWRNAGRARRASVGSPPSYRCPRQR